MAITDMKGTVTKDQPTTTGMMNTDTAKVSAPDMSKIKMPTGMAKARPEQPKEMPVEAPQEMGLAEKVQNLTDQDKIVLATVLSPSVTNVLKKIAPELTPLLDQAGTAEENMIIPVSVVKNFATKRYGGEDETTAVSNFIADLSESSQMDQQPVPPDTQMASQPNDIVSPEMNTVDSGLLA
jgi:hypothetical protein